MASRKTATTGVRSAAVPPSGRTGHLERDGAVVRYQAFGSGEPAVLLLPSWSIVHSDLWRHQIPHLQDRHLVVTFDGLGNGASDRPADPAYYRPDAMADDARAVLDAVGAEDAIVVSNSMGAVWQLILADRFPDRVAACVYIGPDLPLAPEPAGLAEVLPRFDDPAPTSPVGWEMWNREFWHKDWEAFCRFFFSRCFTEPDSQEGIDHFVSMGLETSPDVIASTIDAEHMSEQLAREAAASLEPPTLVIHGDRDAISSIEVGRELARLSGAELITIALGGHEPQSRHPETVNRTLDRFIEDRATVSR